MCCMLCRDDVVVGVCYVMCRVPCVVCVCCAMSCGLFCDVVSASHGAAPDLEQVEGVERAEGVDAIVSQHEPSQVGERVDLPNGLQAGPAEVEERHLLRWHITERTNGG